MYKNLKSIVLFAALLIGYGNVAKAGWIHNKTAYILQAYSNSQPQNRTTLPPHSFVRYSPNTIITVVFSSDLNKQTTKGLQAQGDIVIASAVNPFDDQATMEIDFKASGSCPMSLEPASPAPFSPILWTTGCYPNQNSANQGPWVQKRVITY